MSVGRETKDPAATESFGFDFSSDLASGDTISTSAWAAELLDGTATSELSIGADSHTTTTTTVRVSGGGLGRSYALKNTVVTTLGDTLVRRLLVDVERE